MYNPLVSIVIPTYKRTVFLEKAITSALEQTYKNIEVIVVNDNNIDDEFFLETNRIVEKFHNDNRLIYLNNRGNTGGCNARNDGLNMARGRYVNFLDDDDILLPQKIAEQISIISECKSEVAVVGCYGAIKDDRGNIARIEKPEYDSNNIFFSELCQNLCTTTLNLIRTDICRKAGGFVQMESSQEHLFLINIFKEEPTFLCVKKVLAEINQHDGQRVSNNPRKPYGTLKLTKYIETFYSQLTKEQVKKVRCMRLKQDIYAFCLLKDYQSAKQLFKEKLRLQFFDVNNLKIIYRCWQIYRNGVH